MSEGIRVDRGDDGWVSVLWVNPQGVERRWRVPEEGLADFLSGVLVRRPAPAGYEHAGGWEG